MVMQPTFYWTVHPGDLTRARIIEGARIMVVASAWFDAKRSRLRVRRPPADHIAGMAVDSGGFAMAAKYGRYPWSVEQYVEWVREMSRDVQPDFVAALDYACERGVDRSSLATNRERIEATIHNESACRAVAPGLSWLGVLQGNTVEERAWDVERRRSEGLIEPLMGIGSICGRQAREAAAVLRFYREQLPEVRFHGFGLDVRTLDQGDDLYPLIASWDSYAWCWPRGKKSERPTFLLRWEGETRSAFTLRIAEVYHRSTVQARLERPRQLVLEEAL